MTETIEYSFYFPSVGKMNIINLIMELGVFSIYPVNLSHNGIVIASCEEHFQFNVKQE